MFKKNTAAHVPFALINATTGAALTGATVTARRSLDGGAQAGATGTVSELGNGQYDFSGAAGDLNGDTVGLLFTATGAIPVHVTIRTTTKLVGDLNDSPYNGGAVSSVTGAVGSVTGNVGGNLVGNVNGNVAGSVGSVAPGGIGTAAFAAGAIDAAAFAADAAAEIAAAVEVAILNEADLSAVLEAIRLKIEESDDDLTVAAIATAVWGNATRTLSAFAFQPTVGGYAAGQDPAALLDARLDAIDAAIADVPTVAEFDARTLPAADYATATALATVDDFLDTEVAAIKARTDLIPASPAAVGSAMVLSSSGLDSVAVEAGLNLRQAIAIIAAAVAGQSTGLDTGSVVYRAAGVPATTRITATAAAGNRSAVTLNPPP